MKNSSREHLEHEISQFMALLGTLYFELNIIICIFHCQNLFCMEITCRNLKMNFCECYCQVQGTSYVYPSACRKIIFNRGYKSNIRFF